MKIVILDAYALNPGDLSWEQIKELGEVEIYDRTPSEKIVERAQGAEIILTNKAPINKETINELCELKYIGVLATGYNIIDLKAAAENEIVVTNVPAYSTNTVAQFVFALLLESAHHVGEHNRAVKEGEWAAAQDFTFWDYPLIELEAKTMGIIGFGSIGQKTAQLALAFGMKVISYDRSPEKKISDPAINTEKINFVDLEKLYRDSDVISLHCPLTKETKGMINKESIAKMKDAAILINTARGGLVVESDLAAALKNRKLKTAALDVLSSEPPKLSNKLVNSENTIITPHLAWATKEARERLLTVAAENIKGFLKGEIINQVN